jgi:thyrotropin-releasing hormone receptor
LAGLSALLVRAMRQAERRRRLLKKKGRRLESETAGDYNRTTSMLVAVVLCTVITELPQGILAFLSGIDNDVFLKVYVPLGDVWDMVVLVNSAVNFLLYCTMSHQFRHIFSELFIGRCRIAASRLFPDNSNVTYSAQVGTIKLGSASRTNGGITVSV